MKVAAVTILSLVAISAYASPAAYSETQEVSTHGSTIASSANAYLEKRSGGFYGNHARGMRGADGSPLNNQNHASFPAREHQQHPQRPSSPRLYEPNQPQHPTPPIMPGPYEIPQHTQQQKQQKNRYRFGWYRVRNWYAQQRQYQRNRGPSSPHEISQYAQPVESGSSESNAEVASYELGDEGTGSGSSESNAEVASYEYGDEDTGSEDEESAAIPLPRYTSTKRHRGKSRSSRNQRHSDYIKQKFKKYIDENTEPEDNAEARGSVEAEPVDNKPDVEATKSEGVKPAAIPLPRYTSTKRRRRKSRSSRNLRHSNYIKNRSKKRIVQVNKPKDEANKPEDETTKPEDETTKPEDGESAAIQLPWYSIKRRFGGKSRSSPARKLRSLYNKSIRAIGGWIQEH
ncbi:hypothetical protein BASA50_000814 [Batrachochytrium salamandrivorans]|uniref:Uncharacterized protein n=1 Tax=Batrachochytrium salamandrivorans TaxID=1357716 RepID=A0ABQ8ESZ9_9FUNG|nr:hypothetical protein BASA62_000127 [Batrachochytrium salamandrivorans]KAH6586109.1 hypothetical protein BASA50_000814 [Batrachochytrium salamandrivorans]KAH6599699.1 hypothetical protein BASA61_002467 [Batrachochytrium salamandrivorans]